MDKLSPIKIPLLNPNEPEALLAALEVDEGQKIEKDDLIALVETTKSTGEIRAEESGYLVGLRFAQGDTLQASEVLAYIGSTPDASDSSLSPWSDDMETAYAVDVRWHGSLVCVCAFLDEKKGG